VTDSFERIKMDGGAFDAISFKGRHVWNNEWTALDWMNIQESKSWIRRRANGGPMETPDQNIDHTCVGRLAGRIEWQCGELGSPVVRKFCYDMMAKGGKHGKTGDTYKSWIKWGKCDEWGVPGIATRRRIGNDIPWDPKPLNVPAWRDTKTPRCPNRRTGNYRPNLSSKTNTCCPKKGIPRGEKILTPRTGVYEGVPKPTDWRATFQQMAHPCYRGIYGETKSCKSRLDLQVLECADGCKCKASNGKDTTSIIVTIRHDLLTDAPGCKPWFTLVDSGARAYVSSIRKDIINKKLEKCDGGQGGGGR
jgi:hypothetical protein